MPSLLYAERPRCYPSSCRNSELREAHNTVYNSSSLPTCLAQRAIDRGRRHRVFACQTATKRHRTRHAASIRALATMRIGCLPTARAASEQSRDLNQRHHVCPAASPASPAAHSVQLPTPGPALYLPVPAQTDAHGQDTITPPS